MADHEAGATRRSVEMRDSGVQMLRFHYEEGEHAGKILTVGAFKCDVEGHHVHVGIGTGGSKLPYCYFPMSYADCKALFQFLTQAQKIPTPVPLREAEVAIRQLGDTLKEGMPPGWTFVLAMFSMGSGGHMTYLSSAERRSAIAGLKELIGKMEEDEGRPGQRRNVTPG